MIKGDGRRVDGRRVCVDYERGRIKQEWGGRDQQNHEEYKFGCRVEISAVKNPDIEDWKQERVL